jgi:hypothetical protein
MINVIDQLYPEEGTLGDPQTNTQANGQIDIGLTQPRQ